MATSINGRPWRSITEHGELAGRQAAADEIVKNEVETQSIRHAASGRSVFELTELVEHPSVVGQVCQADADDGYRRLYKGGRALDLILEAAPGQSGRLTVVGTS